MRRSTSSSGLFMSQPPIPDPLGAHGTPLNSEHLADLGRVVCMWAFVEFTVDNMIIFLHGLDHMQFEDLHGRAQMGTKLSTLKKAAERANSVKAASAIRRVCDILIPLNTDRNHVVHGRWGHHFSSKRGKMKVDPAPCAFWAKRNRFPATRLRLLVKNISEASIILDDALVLLTGVEPRPAAGRGLFVGQIVPKGQEHTVRKPPTPRGPSS